MSNEINKNKYLLNEIMEMFDYNPMHVDIEIAQKCMQVANDTDDSQERLAYFNLAHKINGGFIDKIVPSKKAVEMEISLDAIDLPQVVLNGIDEVELLEDKREDEDGD